MLSDVHDVQLVHRRRSVTSIKVRVWNVTSRGAFSHVPMWRALGKVIGLLTSSGKECAQAMLRPYLLAGDQEARIDRPCTWALDFRTNSGSMVLCNDKPSSFGAPDVLAAGVENLKGEGSRRVQRWGRSYLRRWGIVLMCARVGT